MSTSTKQSVLQVLLSFIALTCLIGIVGLAIYGLSFVLTGAIGGAIAGGVIGVIVALASKTFDHQKNHQAAIAEKKREVYRRLLAPWERVLVEIKSGKQGDDLLPGIDLASVYSSAFDVVLYGSATVVQKYAEFRAPSANRDGIDTMRALVALLIAMREDVTGKKSGLPIEAVLGTFMNISEEELLLLRLREYVATHPEAQQRLAEVVNDGAAKENEDAA